MKMKNSKNCKANLWKAIKTTMSEIKHPEVKKKSKDNRFLAVIEKGKYIKQY